MKNNFWKGDFQDYFEITDELRTTCVHPYVARNIENRKFPKILDVGCGKGDFIWTANNFGMYNLDGYDPSKACIEVAKKRFSEFRNISIFDSISKIGTRKYDAIVINFILMTFILKPYLDPP